MTTGLRRGWAEHKYRYSAILEKVPAYGWVGSKRPLGVWMSNPAVSVMDRAEIGKRPTPPLQIAGEGEPKPAVAARG